MRSHTIKQEWLPEVSSEVWVSYKSCTSKSKQGSCGCLWRWLLVTSVVDQIIVWYSALSIYNLKIGHKTLWFLTFHILQVHEQYSRVACMGFTSRENTVWCSFIDMNYMYTNDPSSDKMGLLDARKSFVSNRSTSLMLWSLTKQTIVNLDPFCILHSTQEQLCCHTHLVKSGCAWGHLSG